MKKRVLSLVLCLMLVFSCFPGIIARAADDTAAEGDGQYAGTTVLSGQEGETPASGGEEGVKPLSEDGEGAPAPEDGEGMPASEDGEDGMPASEDGEDGMPASEDGEDGTPASEDGEDGTPAPGDGEDGTPAPGDGEDGTPAPGDGEDGTPVPGDGEKGTPENGNDGDLGEDGNGDPSEEGSGDQPLRLQGTRSQSQTRSITVTIGWAGDIPDGFTYPASVFVTMERSADGVTWEPYTEGGPFEITPDGSSVWTASFDVPSATQDEEPQPYTYRVTEDTEGLDRFLISAPVTVAPEDSGEAGFTNTYNDVWDYTVDLYWKRSGSERYDIRTETLLGDGDALVYQFDIRTQKAYEGIPTTVSDEELLNPTRGLVIRIPLHLFRDRNGSWVDPSGYSISDDSNPTTTREFTYRIIGDEIVFYNHNSLQRGYNASYTVGYTVDPENTLDGSTASLHAEAEGHYSGQPSTDDGRMSTDPITYRIDTGAVISILTKDDGCSMYFANGDLAGLEMDTDTYNYVWYIVRVKAEGNQPATLTITDTPRVFNDDMSALVPGGEVVKVLQWEWTSTKPTAAEETYPAGTDVPFTTGENGSVSWSLQYDAVNANVPLTQHSPAIHYIARAEKDYFVVVRYAKDDYDPYIGDAPNYHNSVSAELEVNDPQNPGDVRPDPANGVTGNDQNDTDAASYDATAYYVPNNGWGWGGGKWTVNKTGGGYGNGAGTSWIMGVPLTSSYNVYMDGDGYELTDIHRGYSMKVWDDDLFARPAYGSYYGSWTRMGPGDYEIISSNTVTQTNLTQVTVHAWQVDRDTGAHLMDTSKLPKGEFRIYAKNADGTWVQIQSFTMTADNSTVTDTQATRTVNIPSASMSGKGYIGLKVESPEGLIDHVDIRIVGIGVRLLSASPLMESWRQQYGDSLKSVSILNYATFRFYEQDSSGSYFWSNPQDGPTAAYTGTDATGLADSEKTADGDYELYEYVLSNLPSVNWSAAAYKNVLNEVNDTTERVYRYQWRLSGMQYINVQGSPNAAMRTFFADSGVFYDILPEGYSIDLTRPVGALGYSANQTGGSNSLYAALDGEPIVINNYKGTGRQLVIFKVKSLLNPGSNYYRGAQQVGTGFCVDFWTVVDYADIKSRTVTNIFGYQRGDRRAFGFAYPNSRGYPRSATNYTVNGKIPLAGVELEVFGTASSGNTTTYASKAVLPVFLPSVQAGLYKHVRGESGRWTSADVTDVDADYAYRLRVQTAGDQTVKYYTGDIVVYDVLENAANTDGHTGETDGWKGTLVSVDTAPARSLGASPVVYYTAKSGISYNSGFSEAWDDSLENNPDIWVRADEYTGDLAAVTAIAIDMRWQADGTTPFTVEGENNLDVIVNMHSPGAVPESQYAYNRPSFQSKTWTENDPESPMISYEIGSRTVLELRDLQDVSFTKYYEAFDPATGEPVQNPLGGATFALYPCTDPEGDYTNAGLPGTAAASSCWSTSALRTTVSDASGTVSFNGLDSGVYAIVETAVPGTPVGIQRLVNRFWVFTVDAVAGTVSDITGYSTGSSYPPVQMEPSNNGLLLEDPFFTTEVSVLKVWDDEDDIDGIRPDHVTVRLLRNGTAYGPDVTLDDDSDWAHTWQSLPKYSAYTSASRNTPYVYTVEEVEVPDDYELVLTGDATVGFTLTNKHTPPAGSLQIAKVVTSGSETDAFSLKLTAVRNGAFVTGSFTAEVTKDEESRTETVVFDANGEAEFTILPGETWLIQGLLVGTVCTVSEVDLAHGWELITPEEQLTVTIPAPDEGGVPQIAAVTLTNEYTPDPTELEIPVEKTVSGQVPPTNETFTFTIEAVTPDAPMPDEAEIEITGAGTGTFGPIPYEEAGEYVYTVTETAGNNTHYSYSSAEYTVTVTVTDEGGSLNASYTLKESGEDADEIVFDNPYTPDPVDLVLGVEKVLTGVLPENGSYTFEFILSPVDGAPEADPASVFVTLPGTATAEFGPLHFTEAGEYVYQVTEQEGDDQGVSYATEPVEVTVTVRDAGGSLEIASVQGAAVSGSGTNVVYRVTVENSYTPDPTELEIPVEKTVSGQVPTTDETFVFTIEAVTPDAPMPDEAEIEITGAGTGTFGPIPYEEAGEYVYTVTETAGRNTHYFYDTSEYTVTVTVTDMGGYLSAEYASEKDGEEADEIVFDNPYTPDPVDLTLGVEKVLTGTLPDNGSYTFEFVLSPVDGAPEADPAEISVTLPGTATAEFGPLHFTEAGEYVYQVTEQEGDDQGVSYATEPVEVTVTVRDAGGSLEIASVQGAAVSGSGTNVVYRVTVENSYTPDPTELEIPVEKTVSGQVPPADETFTFTIEAVTPDAPMPDEAEIEITGAGTESFGAIPYEAAGEYVYTVKETAGSNTHYSYDTAEYTVTVTVTDMGGYLNAEYASEKDGEEADGIVFDNPYTPDLVNLRLPVRKTVEGEPDTEEEFTFTLTGSGDAPMPETAVLTITGAGTASFGEITFEEAGTYTYTVRETAGNAPGFTYDTKVRTVVVTVTDEGGSLEASWTVDDEPADSISFVNTYEPVLTDIPVEKIWDDSDNQDGLRAESVTVHLLADGKDTGKKLVLTAEDGWKGVFRDLPVYAKGVEIEYTVSEDAVPGYDAPVIGKAGDGFTVTNPHTPEKTKIGVLKVWEDKDDKDGKRPSSVTIHLLADGQDTGKKLVLTAKDGWKGEFTDLDVYSEGKKIVYTIAEDLVEDYQKPVIRGDAANGFTVTNEYIPDMPPMGDANRVGLWTMMMLGSLAGLIAAAVTLGRKRRKEGV